ncbi:MAG: 16S rRNA (guanine(966)-N(2))-methyltransferase RsmD [Streptococcaceae bacterium]|jgi:16S rRNA (guanine966-N2)-methyltransferase|nr:16S rRNA (guanine(966)-N(2))-methyltransferase RsmD [Streptococcaceae bacterium]
MRIVAGEFGGRTLKTLSGRDVTRPTTDKVRGAIFNMLGGFFEGGCVLDLYAGTGALGIEAVSRGCACAVLVDQNRAAQAVIAENIAMTKVPEKFELLKMVDRQALVTLMGESYELIFLDPPYARERLVEVLCDLQEKTLLAPGARVVCESAREVELPDKVEGLIKWKEKVYGITRVVIYEKQL